MSNPNLHLYLYLYLYLSIYRSIDLSIYLGDAAQRVARRHTPLPAPAREGDPQAGDGK